MARRAGYYDAICCHLGTNFDVGAVQDAKHVGRRHVSDTVGWPREVGAEAASVASLFDDGDGGLHGFCLVGPVAERPALRLLAVAEPVLAGLLGHEAHGTQADLQVRVPVRPVAEGLGVAEAAGAPVVHVALLALEAEGLLVIDAPLARLLVRRVVLLLRPVLQLREALYLGAAPSNHCKVCVSSSPMSPHRFGYLQK